MFKSICRVIYLLTLLQITISPMLMAAIPSHPQLVKQYTTADGLAINGVNAMCRDRRGYLWIATYDGINRYNGYRFTTYNMQNTQSAFESNRMRAIAELPNGNIIIGNDNGISLYDYEIGAFKTLSLEEVVRRDVNCIVKKIFISGDKSEIYCITEMDGILIYGIDLNFKRQQKYLGATTCNDAMQLDDQTIIIASSSGLECHDMRNGEVEHILSNDIKFANSTLKTSSNIMIVALQEGVQMVEIDRVGREYRFHLCSDVLYSQSMFKTIAIDDNNVVWLGTRFDGVQLVDMNQLGAVDSSITIMKKERISAMLFEDGVNKWVSTYDNGVFRYDDSKAIFTGVNSAELDHLQKVIQVLPYSNNKLLVRTILNQLAIYDITTGLIKYVNLGLTNEELGNIRRITHDNSGLIWLLVSRNNDSYLISVDTKSGKLNRIYNETLPHCQAFSGYVLERDYNGDLWITTSDDVYRVSFTQDMQIKGVEALSNNPYFSSRKIHPSRVVYPDQYRNQLWIGCTTDGLYRLQLDKSKSLKEVEVSHFEHNKLDSKSLSSNTVSAIHRTQSGVLYIGTEHGGLCRVNERGYDVDFKRYLQLDGLSNNVVKGISTDQDGNLWVSTNIGLNHFSPREEQFTTYRSSDGIPFDNFNYICTKLPSGRLVFSGGNNILHFNPIEIPNKEERPNMWFSSLSINDNSIESGEEFGERVILQKSLSDGDYIELKYDENRVAIGVDVICKDNSDNYKIEYKLEPHSRNWTTIPASDGTILYDGLQPDTYKLSVRCCNFYGVWSESKELTIKITPPIWKTTAAYVIYFALFFIVLGVVLYVIFHLLALRHRLDIEVISKRNLENMNREKQRYFSNISHELKTPLTLILAPIAVLSDKFKLDVSVTHSLQVISRQSKKMLQLIDLAHNVQLESDNMLVLKPSIFDFKKFVEEITHDFKYYSDSDSKSLIIGNVERDVIVNADKSLIEKIMNNLLSNAFKHTRQQDTITFSYTVEKNILTFTVEDSGYGIDEKDLPRIFERFYQAKKRGAANIGGTGIGLTFSQTIARLHGGEIDVESKFGVGTKFTVRLPIVEDTTLYECDEVVEVENVATENIESTMILGDMNIDSIKVREDLQGSMVYLVEDNPDMREFLESIIKQFYKVETYTNGVECLEAMKNSWPDIVLTDVMMPQMDGYELCSAIKNNTLTSHIPVIMLTACSTIDEKIKGLSCGADSYIPKPFYPRHTITRIDALLYNRKKLRERFLVDEIIVKGPTGGNRDNEFMNNLYKLFSDNLSNEDIDLDDIATQMCVSRTLFFQKIKAITNDSPYELLKNYRLKRAAEYLSVGDVQVNEVSFLVGFKSRTHFSKLFKDKYGHTPGKYSKLAKSGEL